MYWPYITVQIVDKARVGALNRAFKVFIPGCEQCFTTITLNDIISEEFYKTGIVDEIDILFARAQMSKNQDAI
jgi:hypothetical protein